MIDYQDEHFYRGTGLSWATMITTILQKSFYKSQSKLGAYKRNCISGLLCVVYNPWVICQGQIQEEGYRPAETPLQIVTTHFSRIFLTIQALYCHIFGGENNLCIPTLCMCYGLPFTKYCLTFWALTASSY